MSKTQKNITTNINSKKIIEAFCKENYAKYNEYIKIRKYEKANYYKQKYKKIQFETNFKNLDNNFGGLKTNEITVVAGRPYTGNLFFCYNIILNLLLQGKSCIIFSLQMSKNMCYQFLANILIQTESKYNSNLQIDNDKILNKKLTWLKKSKLEILDGKMTTEDIIHYFKFDEKGIRDLVPDLVFIDDTTLIIKNRNKSFSVKHIKNFINYNTAVLISATTKRNKPYKICDSILYKLADKIMLIKQYQNFTGSKSDLKIEFFLSENDKNILQNEKEIKIIKNTSGNRGKFVIYADKNNKVFRENTY